MHRKNFGIADEGLQPSLVKGCIHIRCDPKRLVEVTSEERESTETL